MDDSFKVIIPLVTDRHGGTYNTSDNFPAQKDGCQNGVAPHTFTLFSLFHD